jgi:hypothetical protein
MTMSEQRINVLTAFSLIVMQRPFAPWCVSALFVRIWRDWVAVLSRNREGKVQRKIFNDRNRNVEGFCVGQRSDVNGWMLLHITGMQDSLEDLLPPLPHYITLSGLWTAQRTSANTGSQMHIDVTSLPILRLHPEDAIVVGLGGVPKFED